MGVRIPVFHDGCLRVSTSPVTASNWRRERFDLEISFALREWTPIRRHSWDRVS